MPNIEEFIQTLDLTNNEDRVIAVEILGKLDRSLKYGELVANKERGHFEAAIAIPYDHQQQRPKTLSEKEQREQLTQTYDEIITADPFLKFRLDNYIKPPKVQSARSIKYHKQNELHREEARKMLWNFATKNSCDLTPFERSILEELRIAQKMGINIPFLFSGKKDEFIEALKEQRRLDKSISKEQLKENEIALLISQLSPLQLEQYAILAKNVLSKLTNQNPIEIKEDFNGNSNV